MPATTRVDRRPPGSWRAALAGLGLVMWAALLGGPPTPAGAATPTTVAPTRTTTSTTVPGPVTLTVADQDGVLQALFATTGQLAGAGYTVEWADEPTGTAALAAEGAGAVDVAVVGDTPVIFAQAAGMPVAVVAVQSLAPARDARVAVVVPTASTVTSTRDLAGRTVAVTPGSVGQYLLARALARAGLAYRSVHPSPVDPSQAAAAVAAGTVDAAAVSQPYLAELVHGGQVRVLVPGSPLVKCWAYVVTSRAALGQPAERPAVLDFVRRLVNAERLAAAERPLAAATWATQDQLSAAVATAALGQTTATGLKVTPAVLAYQQAEADLLHHDGLVAGRLDTAREFALAVNRLVVADRVPVVPQTTTTTTGAAGPSPP